MVTPNPKQLRLVTALVVMTCVIASTGAITLAVLWPVEGTSARTDGADSSSHTPPADASRAGLPSLDSFAVIWDKGGAPAPDFPAGGDYPSYSVDDTLQLTLVGTAIEGRRSVALLLDGDNELQVRSVGQSIGDATILGIEETRVRIEYAGRPAILELREWNEPAPPAPAPEVMSEY